MSKIAFRSSFMCWWMGVFCSKLFRHRLEHAFKSFVNKIFSDEQAFLHGRYQYLHTYFRFFKCMATDTSLTLIGQIQMYYTCNSIYYVKIVSNWLSYRKYKDIDWVIQSLSMFSHLVFREIVYGERFKKEIERDRMDWRSLEILTQTFCFCTNYCINSETCVNKVSKPCVCLQRFIRWQDWVARVFIFHFQFRAKLKTFAKQFFSSLSKSFSFRFFP